MKTVHAYQRGCNGWGIFYQREDLLVYTTLFSVPEIGHFCSVDLADSQRFASQASAGPGASQKGLFF